MLERRADLDTLLARNDERVPPTAIPEEWHIRLSLPQRPSYLDDHGGRFLWTPTSSSQASMPAADDGAARRSSSPPAARSASTSTSTAGLLTVFPFAEPYGALDIELLEHWLAEMLAAARMETAVGGDADGGAASRQRVLEVYALAVYEVGRACGTARCALLQRLWQRASAAWRVECDAAIRSEQGERQRLTAAVRQKDRELNELHVRVSDAEERARADRAALHDVRRGGVHAVARAADDGKAARAAVVHAQQANDRATARLHAAAAYLHEQAATVGSAAATEAMLTAAATLELPDAFAAAHSPPLQRAATTRPKSAASHGSGAGEAARSSGGARRGSAPSAAGSTIGGAPHAERLSRRRAPAGPLAAAGDADDDVELDPAAYDEIEQLGDWHDFMLGAQERLQSATREAEEHAATIITNGAAFRAQLDAHQTKLQREQVVLRQSGQLVAALGMMDHGEATASIGVQTTLGRAEVSAAVVDVVRQQTAPRPNEWASTADQRRREERNEPFSTALRSVDEISPDGLEWVGGHGGRAVAAARLKGVLLAAGLASDADAFDDAGCQCNLLDEHHGNVHWAEPLPKKWRPLVATLAPLPMGIFGARRARALIWAIYTARLDSEPGLRRVEALPYRGKWPTHEAAAAAAAVYGGAAATHADGEDAPREALPPRDDFCDFVVDWLTHHYGAPTLAAAQLTALVAAVRVHLTATNNDKRLRTFSRLCGACADEPAIGAPSLSFLMRAVHLSFTLSAGAVASFPLDASILLSLDRAHAVIHALFATQNQFGPPRPESAERLREHMVEVAKGHGGSTARASLDLDEFVLACLEEHEASRKPPRVRAGLLALFALADANDDGYLSHEELQTLMSNQGYTNKEATTRYYQMLKSERDTYEACPHAAATGGVAATGAASLSGAPVATSDAKADARANAGVQITEFLVHCAALSFMHDPRPLDTPEDAELDLLDREWLTKQHHVATALGRLQDFVIRTGGDAPTAYPSGLLLAQARAALAELSRQLGAFTRGKAASPRVVRHKLEELLAVCARGEVAMAIEEAGLVYDVDTR